MPRPPQFRTKGAGGATRLGPGPGSADASAAAESVLRDIERLNLRHDVRFGIEVVLSDAQAGAAVTLLRRLHVRWEEREWEKQS